MLGIIIKLKDLIMDIRVYDTIFDPSDNSNSRIALYRDVSSGKRLFRVFIYLKGQDLPFVENVTYTLHSSFANPNKEVIRTVTNQRCKLIIWSWSLFEAQVRIHLKGRRTISGKYALRFGQDITSDVHYMKDRTSFR